MNVYGIVYKATNLFDGKIYIGQTVQKLWNRKRAHENLATRSTAYFHRAIAKHGLKNFMWEAVESCSSKEQLHARERFWIEHFQCMAPAGYNSAEGGKGGAYTEAHKRRISEAMRGRRLSMETREKMRLLRLGKKLTAETVAKFKAKTGDNNPFFGRTHTAETKRLIGEKSFGRNWATGQNAGSWADVDRRIILECYFAKMSNNQMISVHLEKTGRKIGIKALFRAFRELGLHVSSSRGKKGLLERREFIDSNDIEAFYERLANLTSPS